MTGASYVLKDIEEFVSAIDNNETISYGKLLTFTHDMSAFTPETQNIISFLRTYFREKKKNTYAYGKGHSKQIELAGNEIDDFFNIVSKVYFRNADFRARYTEERLLEITPVFPPIDLTIDKTPNGINFEASAFTMFEGHTNIYFERLLGDTFPPFYFYVKLSCLISQRFSLLRKQNSSFSLDFFLIGG